MDTDTPWFAGPMTAFDLESTGVDTEEAHVVTAAVIDLGFRRPTVTHTWLAAVEIDIPAEAAAIHGISTEEARKDGRPPLEVLDEVAAMLADSLQNVVPIVGHNVKYDLTLLDRELRRKGLPTLEQRCSGGGPVICTRVLDQHVVPRRRRPSKDQGARTLQTTAGVYGLPWDEQAAHGCEYDALQAARIAYKIGHIAHTPPAGRPEWVRRLQMQSFGDVADISLADLFLVQQQWASEQAASLQDYFRTKAPPEMGGDPDKVIDPCWPMQPFGGAR